MATFTTQLSHSSQGDGNKRRSILVLDDDAKILRTVKSFFSDTDYEVVIADNAEMARASIEASIPDVVLCDMRMPDVSGPQFLKEIRGRYPDIVRLAMSGVFDVADTIAAINEGSVSAYLVKPFSSHDVKLTVYSALLDRDKKAEELLRARQSRANARQRAIQIGQTAARIREAAYQIRLDFLNIIREIGPNALEQDLISESMVYINELGKVLGLNRETILNIELVLNVMCIKEESEKENVLRLFCNISTLNQAREILSQIESKDIQDPAAKLIKAVLAFTKAVRQGKEKESVLAAMSRRENFDGLIVELLRNGTCVESNHLH